MNCQQADQPTDGGDDQEVIVASAYLRSQSGRSLFENRRRAVRDLEPYLPSPETRRAAVAGLEELGFTVEAAGVTLSFSGPRRLFEELCGVAVDIEQLASERGRRATVAHVSTPEVFTVPGLGHLIEAVVFVVPGAGF